MQDFFEKHRYTLVKTLNLVIVVVLFAGFSIWAAAANAHDEAVAAQIAQAERSMNRGPYATDGVFEGSARGFGGQVTMSVTIVNGYIERVDAVDVSHEDEAWLDMCAGVPQSIVKAQGTNIDTVSGATYTSAGMLNAVTEALEKSMQGGVS